MSAEALAVETTNDSITTIETIGFTSDCIARVACGSCIFLDKCLRTRPDDDEGVIDVPETETGDTVDSVFVPDSQGVEIPIVVEQQTIEPSRQNDTSNKPAIQPLGRRVAEPIDSRPSPKKVNRPTKLPVEKEERTPSEYAPTVDTVSVEHAEVQPERNEVIESVATASETMESPIEQPAHIEVRPEATTPLSVAVKESLKYTQQESSAIAEPARDVHIAAATEDLVEKPEIDEVLDDFIFVSGEQDVVETVEEYNDDREEIKVSTSESLLDVFVDAEEALAPVEAMSSYEREIELEVGHTDVDIDIDIDIDGIAYETDGQQSQRDENEGELSYVFSTSDESVERNVEDLEINDESADILEYTPSGGTVRLIPTAPLRTSIRLGALAIYHGLLNFNRGNVVLTLNK